MRERSPSESNREGNAPPSLLVHSPPLYPSLELVFVSHLRAPPKMLNATTPTRRTNGTPSSSRRANGTPLSVGRSGGSDHSPRSSFAAFPPISPGRVFQPPFRPSSLLTYNDREAIVGGWSVEDEMLTQDVLPTQEQFLDAIGGNNPMNSHLATMGLINVATCRDVMAADLLTTTRAIDELTTSIGGIQEPLRGAKQEMDQAKSVSNGRFERALGANSPYFL